MNRSIPEPSVAPKGGDLVLGLVLTLDHSTTWPLGHFFVAAWLQSKSMKTSDDIATQQRQAEGEFLPFGEPIDGQTIEVVQTFGFYEAEYAVLRKGVGIIDEPWRGLLRLTGSDVKDFLHQLLTQDIRGMKGGDSRRSFLLNEKGRIVADLWVHHGDIDTWLETDRMDLPAVKSALEGKLFSEDVTLTDISQQWVNFALHGPAAWQLLCEVITGDKPALMEKPGTHHVVSIGAARVSVYQNDQVGALGLQLWVPTEHAGEVYQRLTQIVGGIAPAFTNANDPGQHDKRPTILGRGVGWLAFNTARIEASQPMFHIDFGPDCLPHETGLLKATTSFNKGCYVGQEIVARMENLGQPKRVIAGFVCEDDRLPISGSAVHELVQQPRDEKLTPGVPGAGDVIGGVTSSTVSPMLGNVAIGLAMMKQGRHEKGTKVLLPAEGAWSVATIR